MAKHRFEEKVVRPGAAKKSRSMRGVSRKEAGQERFELALNNVAPEHQALFRRHWMKFQGSRKRTGKEPHEAFYDWLNEHPETLIELEERNVPTDDELARAELVARKTAGKSLKDTSSRAQKAKNAKRLADWQLREKRKEFREENRARTSGCRLQAHQNAALTKTRKADVFSANDEFCENDYFTLSKSAANATCSARAKIEKAKRKKAVLDAQLTRRQHEFDCAQANIKKRQALLSYEIKIQNNVISANRSLKRKPTRKKEELIPF